jgi:predicted transport protein
VNIDDLFQGIRKLVIVDIALDREDNPQLIFESLNSTGLDLSQSDLIRNYVLMGMKEEEQKEVYTNSWHPMEQRFLEGQNEEKFDYFMRGYLTIKMGGTIPRLDSVYAAFKQYIYTKNIKEIVADVCKFSQYYEKLEFNKESDPNIRNAITDIRTLKVEVAYPFLMEVYDDFVNGTLTKDKFLQILKLTESYVFRRAICGIPTNSLNKTFATLYREIDKEKYLESLKAIFILKNSYHRFPKDEEFKSELIKKDVYNFRNVKYLLEKIEYFDNKERVDLDDLSVEHIMPQTLTSTWKEALGEDFKRIQNEFLHTIGNLTLTGYNPDMSNKSFTEKRDMEKGFKESCIRLNKDLIKLETWNEEEINKRANKLSKKALKIWGYPELDPEILEEYKARFSPEKETDYSIEDYEYLQGDILTLFELLKERIMGLHPDVREECMKLYVAYKTTTNFVDIVPQKTRLRLSLNMKYEDIDDPKGITIDVTNKGRWGNGDVEVAISSPKDINYATFLIKQSLAQHS